ncbi:MAG: MFS transporter [Alphaproteobacteria bacterium]|nr:MFS transporter [Alphaproteobacteria bacterium]
MRRYADFALRHWRLLGFGATLTFASSFGQTFFISLFSSEIRAEFGLSDGAFGAIYSLGTLLSAGVLLITGPLIDRLDLRLYATLALLGLSGAAVLLAGAESAALLILVIFMLRQFGQALPGHTAITAMGRYFGEGRGKAISLVSLGYPLGEALLPIVAVAMVALLGWREAWLSFAVLLSLIAAPATLFFLVGHGDRHAAYLADLNRSASGPEHASADRLGDFSWTRAQMLRDPRLYILLPAILAPSFIFTGLFFHQIPILVEMKGWSRTALAASYPLYAGTVVLTSLAAGLAIDRFGAVRLLPWFLPPQMLAVVVLMVSDAPWLLWPYMFLTGLSVGITHTMLGALAPELYGRRHLGAIRSAYTAAMVFSSAASPVVMGLLFDWGWGVNAVAALLLLYALIGMALSVIAMRRYLVPVPPPA